MTSTPEPTRLRARGMASGPPLTAPATRSRPCWSLLALGCSRRLKMSLTVIKPLSTPCASTTGSFSIRCLARIRSASSSPVPTGTVTSLSLVITSRRGCSRLFSNCRSRLVMMPTSRPWPSTMGTPEIRKRRINAMASFRRRSGPSVIGFMIIPLSLRFTRSTSAACRSMVMFLCRTPMPPARAMAMAISASVTVSMAADTSGILRGMVRVRRVTVETSRGWTVECRGTSSTSSKVRPSLGRITLMCSRPYTRWPTGARYGRAAGQSSIGPSPTLAVACVLIKLEAPPLRSIILLSPSGAASYDEQMRTDAEECRLGFQRCDCIEQRRTAALLAEACVYIRQEPADPFHRKGSSAFQPGRRALHCQFFGPVEVSSREVCRVAGGVPVLPVLTIPRGYSREHRVLQVVTPETIQSGRKARNARRHNASTRTAHPTCLGQSLEPLGSLAQMVERAEQEDSVHARIRERKLARVPHLRAGEHRGGAALRGRTRLLDVERHRVHQVNPVSPPGEPQRVSARPAADVCQHRWCCRKVPLEQLLSP